MMRLPRLRLAMTKPNLVVLNGVYHNDKAKPCHSEERSDEEAPSL